MSSNDDIAARARPSRMTLFFIALAVLSLAGLWLHAGPSEAVDALRSAAWLLLGIGPVVVLALFVGGYVQALLPRDLVARWLGAESGAGGYLLAILAGVLTPAGPFGAFPLAVALRHAGAPFEICVVYLSAWATLGIHRIVIWELPFLGPEFTALRVVVSLPLPIVAGLVAAAVAVRYRR